MRAEVDFRVAEGQPIGREGARFLGWLAALSVPAVTLAVTGWRPVLPGELYLPLHALVEMVIAFVGLATFAVQWYAARAKGSSEPRSRVIAVAFLGMALLEMTHLLVFPGMPGIFGASSTERGIFYWLAGRLWLTGMLLVAARLPAQSEHWALRRRVLAAGALALFCGFVAVEVLAPYEGLFYRPGVGLTPLKVALEMLVGAVALAGAVLHWWRFRTGGDRVYVRIALALFTVALAELCFTLYVSAYDAWNVLGHLYSAFSAVLVLDALFVGAILEPYARAEGAARDLAATNEYLARLRGHIEGELATTIGRLEEQSAAALEARAELEAAIQASPSGIVVYAPDGRIVTLNSGAQRLLRYDEVVRGLPLAERWEHHLHARQEDGTALTADNNPAVRALRGETVRGTSIVIAPATGGERWVQMSAAPVRGEGGAIVGAVANLTDVTEIQQLQAERQDLLRAVSHDLRNPLQIVLLQAERLQRLLPEDAAKERRSAEAIGNAARNMGAMIRDLVEAVRLESGQLALRPETLSLSGWIRDRVAMSAGVLDVGRIAFEFDEDLPPVRADPERLDRVVTNLVGNALKYSQAPAEVRVGARRRGDLVEVWIADRGVGIAAEDLPRVFERFYRGRLTTRSEGLGLGLFIVRTLVEAQGGTIRAESRVAEGSTFFFTLPVAA